MIEYDLVLESDALDMRRTIRSMSKDGWRLLGPVHKSEGEDFISYLATLYRDTKTEGEEG